MKLNDLFEQLALGELSQHKFGSTGAILLEDYPSLITHINRGLSALHAYFPLSHKELTLIQFDSITSYQIDPKYSLSANDPTVSDKYIFDSVENPFLDDLIRIHAAFNSEGYNVPLNDEFKANSWFTPNPDMLQIPFPIEGDIVSVMYQANHAKIDSVLTDPSSVTIILPQCLEAALSAYVASRVYLSLGNQTSAQLSAYYSQVYQSELAQVKRLNLLLSSEDSSNHKFITGGWK